MNAYTFTDERGRAWSRVTKTTARKLYAAREPLTVCGCNMRPFGAWGIGCTIQPADYVPGQTFDQMDANATYYNCDNERGRYLAFYRLEA